MANLLDEKLVENFMKMTKLKQIHIKKGKEFDLELHTHIFKGFNNFSAEKLVEKSSSDGTENKRIEIKYRLSAINVQYACELSNFNNHDVRNCLTNIRKSI